MTDRDVFLQKRILDWSLTLPGWQRGLMRKLCDGPLDEAGRAEVLAVLLGETGAPALPPLELANLPADEADYGTVELRQIRNLRNVNSLAGDQALGFRPGLNVVFGENGAGKSGYGDSAAASAGRRNRARCCTTSSTPARSRCRRAPSSCSRSMARSASSRST